MNFQRAVAFAPFALLLALSLPASGQETQDTAPAAITAPDQAAVPADDNLNAVLWMQHSVEYQASVATAFALAKRRLIQALGDKAWPNAAPEEQKGKYQSLPPAIIADVDETLLDNSSYQGWNITAGTQFSNDTWSKFVHAEVSKAIPGAVEFTKYAASRGVKVFYVSNRTRDGEDATRDNMTKLGFPMDTKIDTLLSQGEQDDWTSKKGTRRAFIAKKYRILLMLGDNFGDFVDAYKGTEEDRQKVYDANAAHWGRDWIMFPNPSYGSFEAVPYKFDYGAAPEAMRDAKRKALNSWDGQ